MLPAGWRQPRHSFALCSSLGGGNPNAHRCGGRSDGDNIKIQRRDAAARVRSLRILLRSTARIPYPNIQLVPPVCTEIFGGARGCSWCALVSSGSCGCLAAGGAVLQQWAFEGSVAGIRWRVGSLAAVASKSGRVAWCSGDCYSNRATLHSALGKLIVMVLQ